VVDVITVASAAVAPFGAPLVVDVTSCVSTLDPTPPPAILVPPEVVNVAGPMVTDAELNPVRMAAATATLATTDAVRRSEDTLWVPRFEPRKTHASMTTRTLLGQRR
jgi:hypothetical protein